MMQSFIQKVIFFNGLPLNNMSKFILNVKTTQCTNALLTFWHANSSHHLAEVREIRAHRDEPGSSLIVQFAPLFLKTTLDLSVIVVRVLALHRVSPLLAEHGVLDDVLIRDVLREFDVRRRLSRRFRQPLLLTRRRRFGIRRTVGCRRRRHGVFGQRFPRLFCVRQRLVLSDTIF